MPSFEYTAIDRQGNSISGQVQAATRDEAAVSLTKTGLLVSRLVQAGGGAATVQPRNIPISQGAPRSGAPPLLSSQPKATTQQAAPKRAATTAKKPAIRTARGTDKDIYFVFSQLQSYSRAGTNPVHYLTSLGNNCPRRDYGEALLVAADAAKEGKPISDVFEQYVDLFPPHVVGMVRAAEHGGFFPEAYDLITDQAHASHKFRIWFVYLLATAVMVGVCLPIAALALRGALGAWDALEKSPEASGTSTFLGEIWKQLLWPCGPITLMLVIGFWLFGKYWQALPQRPLRHRLSLLLPSVNKRARAESLSVFAWTMSNLAKVGMPPKTVWELSVGTIPNLEIRSRMAETGRQMSEQTRLSEAMTMSQQVPDEYAPIVQTGEVTGDVPGALMRASQTQLEEFKASDQMSKMRVGCWIFLLMGVGSAILMGMYYGGFMKPLMNKILGE
jgi:general secretion pathway protein F